MLPMILKVQDDFTVAARFIRDYHRRKALAGEVPSRDELARHLKPTLGVKVGRQVWLKGRSIKHCLDMGHGRMRCEEKIDGEYCQIHVDLSKGRDCIQIFSKSGKDSTRDRAGLHEAIRTSLRIGQPSCPLKTGCILEGELVVFSDKEEKILDFHKIRKYVSRSGRFIGTDEDSQRHSWEHLMIVYFDALMIDDESLLGVKQSDRFKRLGQLVTCKQGRSALVKSSIIDCNGRNAASDLRRAFAKCITARREGLVLKADDPYFDFSTTRRPYSCSCIKLKKEYVGSFGDVGDFAVVGARYDAAMAKTYGIPNLKWTHFFIGCLENKEEVQRWSGVPRFTVTNVVELNATQLKYFMSHVNPSCVPESENESIFLRIAPGIDNGKRPSMVFTEPPVFDIRCFSFEKAGNTGFWGLRFPMVSKVHCDRTYSETISFSELQEMAKLEKEIPPPEDSQELLGFIAALEQADPGGLPVDAVSQLTESTISTVMTPSSMQSSAPPNCESPTLPHVLENHPISTLPSSVVGPLTPPVSSAAKPAELDGVPAAAERRTTQTSRRSPKRRLEAQGAPRRSKSQKCTANPGLAASTSSQGGSSPKRKSPSRTPRPLRKAREPLADITSSSQPHDNLAPPRMARIDGVHSFYSPTMERPRPSSFSQGPAASTPRPLNTATSSSFRRPRVEIPDSQPSNESSIYTFQASKSDRPTKCIYCPETCALTGISFLLAPCVSQTPWLTEDLLSSHGILNFTLNPEDWKRSRLKKVVLVESRRKEATEALFRRIEQAGFERRGGRREYVPVFDWRLLEALTKEESECRRSGKEQDSRFDMKNSQSIWRKYWIGLA